MLFPNAGSHPRLPAHIFIYIIAQLPQNYQSLLVLLSCFLVVFDGLTDVLLCPKAVSETLSQFELRCVVFDGCSNGVVEKSSFGHFWHSVPLLIHHSHEIVSLTVLLIFRDDLSTVPVELRQLVIGAAVHVAEHQLNVHYPALDVALLSRPPNQAF